MIWARPFTPTPTSALWRRSGLGDPEVALLEAGRECLALVTGLDVSAREALAELVDAAWVGGAGDAAIVRYSPLSLDRWAQAPGALGEAFGRLRSLVCATSRTRIMGIVNVTPDSFSDGGRYATPDAAIAHGLALVKQGADLLDVGGESTRPGAAPVSEADELQRVVPVIEGLRGCGVPLSVDTMKATVARAAIAAGASVVNDVGGLRDDAMIDVLAETGASACVMHMQGEPRTMQHAPTYDDVSSEVLDALELALRRAEARGVARSRLWVDPGIGFGKTGEHNLFLLRHVAELRLLGVPVLVGVSRKRFLGALVGDKPAPERVVASAAAAAIVAATGAVDVVRVHDVTETKDALAVADAIRLARDGGGRFT